MQNKAAIIILAIALALVSVYELSFTAATAKVKKDAKEYADGDLVRQNQYIDSIASLPKDQWNYLGFTFKEVQKKEINLGLDLKGGMNVILEVSVEDIIRALSNYNTDPVFTQALARANELLIQNQSDYLTLFGRAFEEIDPNAKLAAIFNTVDLRNRVNFNSTNEEVLEVLEEEVDGAISNAFNILSSRIDRFGVVQPSITQMGTKGRILIQLPGQTDYQRVRELLQGTASLEFWETYENAEVLGFLAEANNLLRDIVLSTSELPGQTETDSVVTDTTRTGDDALLDLIESDATAVGEPATREDFNRQNPLFGILTPRVTAQGEPLPS